MLQSEYISTNTQLDACVDHLTITSEVALDLEFDKNRYRYGFNLCLVQIYGGDKCFLIDPLSKDLDITRLFPLLENEAIQKVVFAFGEDLRLLHSLGCFPKNVFDINIATKLLDYEPASLAKYLVDLLQVDADKGAQNSNWFTRPLTDEQLHYAEKDVLHLFDLKNFLVAKAEEKKILNWIEEEVAVFNELSYADVESIVLYKTKDKKGLTEFEWFLFVKLVDFREKIAEKLNRPGYQVIDKDTLFEIAKNPTVIKGWENRKRIHRSIKNKSFEKELHQLLQETEKEAQDASISKTEPEIKRLSPEESNSRRIKGMKTDKIKTTVFKPIQGLVRANHGEHVVTYILGNKLMNELAAGNKENLHNYKKELFLKYAAELGIEASSYL